nr:MAG TPA: hypothetical protein [Caudoviricetes sp.]
MYLDPNRKWRSAQWVRSQLLQCQELTDLLGGKIFPILAPEDTAGDFIAVYRSAYGREYDKTGDAHSITTVTVLCICNDYDRSLQLCELVDAVLDGGRNDEVDKVFGASSITGITATLDSSEEYFQDGKIVQSLTFAIS